MSDVTLVEANPVASLRDKAAKLPAVEASDITLNGISKIFTTRRGDVHALEDVKFSRSVARNSSAYWGRAGAASRRLEH